MMIMMTGIYEYIYICMYVKEDYAGKTKKKEKEGEEEGEENTFLYRSSLFFFNYYYLL